MKLTKILTGVLLAGATTLSLNAAGTAAGTVITNNATLDFDVGGVAQPQIPSNASDFTVDNKIIFTIATTDVTQVIEAPAIDAITTFEVTNTGNKASDYRLTAADNDLINPFGITDNSNPDSYQIFVEEGTTPGYQAAEDTVTFIDELAPDATATVYVLSLVPVAAATGDQSGHTLTAIAADSGTPGALDADTPNTAGVDNEDLEDNVWADVAGDTDALNDGQNSASSAYEVLIPAALTIAKSSIIIDDYVNVAPNFKRIPGATIRFCFTVDNTGGATADNVIITDDLSVNNLDQLDTAGATFQSGFILQDILTPCDCAAIVNTAGTYAAPNVTINMGSVTGTPTPATQRGCAYIQADILAI